MTLLLVRGNHMLHSNSLVFDKANFLVYSNDMFCLPTNKLLFITCSLLNFLLHIVQQANIDNITANKTVFHPLFISKIKSSPVCFEQ